MNDSKAPFIIDRCSQQWWRAFSSGKRCPVRGTRKYGRCGRCLENVSSPVFSALRSTDLTLTLRFWPKRRERDWLRAFQYRRSGSAWSKLS